MRTAHSELFGARASVLSELAIGAGATVRGIELEPREAEWLRAVGLFEGEGVLVLRRAPLGGPLHVRTSAGAEFAVDRDLAASGRVAIAPPVEPRA